MVPVVTYGASERLVYLPTDAGILIRHIKNNNIKITDFEMYHSNVVYETGIAILVTLQMEKRQPHATVINSIGLLRGIKNVEEV